MWEEWGSGKTVEKFFQDLQSPSRCSRAASKEFYFETFLFSALHSFDWNTEPGPHLCNVTIMCVGLCLHKVKALRNCSVPLVPGCRIHWYKRESPETVCPLASQLLHFRVIQSIHFSLSLSLSQDKLTYCLITILPWAITKKRERGIWMCRAELNMGHWALEINEMWCPGCCFWMVGHRKVPHVKMARITEGRKLGRCTVKRMTCITLVQCPLEL